VVTTTSNLPLSEIESAVRERAPQMFGQTGPVEEVDLEVHHTVFIVDCRFGSDTHRLVVKPQPREVGVGDTWQLGELHQAVRDASDSLEKRLVRFLGVDKERDLVFMDYVEGISLEELLKNDVGANREVVESALREVALVLRALRGLETNNLPTPAARRQNGSYRRQLEETIHSSEFSRWLGRTREQVDTNLKLFPSSFWERRDDGLNLEDFQPKNVLVRPDGRIRVIDVNYTTGNPTQTLAFFMLNLDVLAIRWPTGAALERAASWKRLVLEEYIRDDPAAERWLRDLKFFYPWKLAAMYRQHSERHPWAQHYLAWFYSKLLKSSLTEWSGSPAAT
jgi:aminoglycoside phosphotransferase (APT) family kinase protein